MIKLFCRTREASKIDKDNYKFPSSLESELQGL